MLTTGILIDNFSTALNNNLKRIDNTFDSLSLNQISWKPGLKIWSVGECINHLVLTNDLYLKKMREIVYKSTSDSNVGFNYSQSLTGKLITNTVDPGNVKKFKTFKVFDPLKSSAVNSVVQNYTLIMKRFIEMVDDMSGINLKKIKFSSPVNKFIRLNLGDPLIFIPRHDKRHLDQAERMMNLAEFPKE
jgi:hypothetical protein